MGLNKRLIDQSGAAGIENPTDYFDIVTYTGNGTSKTISSLNFKPDLVWIKQRDTVNIYHVLSDSINGTGFYYSTDQPNQPISTTTRITSFTSNGFSLGNDFSVNRNGVSYVAWCWRAGNGSVSNNNGSVVSTVSSAPEAGFSIVKYTLSGIKTVGHGLNNPPQFMLNRKYSFGGWYGYSETSGPSSTVSIDSTGGASSTTVYNSTSPTSSVFTYNDTNTYIALCWHSVSGFSKIGGYIGASGQSIICDFAPRFVMIKNIDSAAVTNWVMFDSVRGVPTSSDLELTANTMQIEYNVGERIQFYSDRFTLTSTNANYNQAGKQYIYMAFA